MATTTISITVNTPTGISVQNVLDTLCTYWGYSVLLPDGVTPNPQTKGQFVQAKVGDFLRQSYIAAKANVDAEAARQASITTSGQVTVS